MAVMIRCTNVCLCRVEFRWCYIIFFKINKLLICFASHTLHVFVFVYFLPSLVTCLPLSCNTYQLGDLRQMLSLVKPASHIFIYLFIFHYRHHYTRRGKCYLPSSYRHSWLASVAVIDRTMPSLSPSEQNHGPPQMADLNL